MAPNVTAAVFAASLLLAAPARACFLENTDFPGHDVDRLLGKVYSAAECQRQCQGRADCSFWTYDPASNSCYMKSGDAVEAQRPCEGLVSGPRTCPGPVDCSQAGIDLYGDDLINTQVANPLACQFQCSAVQGCVYWSFLPSNNRCYLKGPNVSPKAHDEAVSGPKECPTTTPIGCEPGTDFLGHDLRSFYGTVTEAATCKELCQSFNNCFFWTFVPSTASCYLKDEKAEEGREYNPRTHSGARDCSFSLQLPQPRVDNTTTTTTTTTVSPPGTCFLKDTDFPGSDITAFGLGAVTKPEACQLLCQYTRECFFFTFFEGTCYFKSAAAPEKVIKKLAAVSGPKYCKAMEHQPMPLPIFPGPIPSDNNNPTPTTTTTTTTKPTTITTASGDTRPLTSTTTAAPHQPTSSVGETLLRFLRAPPHH